MVYQSMFIFLPYFFFFFFFNDTATTEIYTLSLHDALPICASDDWSGWHLGRRRYAVWVLELQALGPAEGEAVRRAYAQARQALDAALVPRYERQLHVTLATAGFLDGDAALPDAYGAAELSRGLRALQDLPAAPLQLEFGGWGSFEMAPYLQVRDRSQGGPTLGMLQIGRASCRERV